MTKTVEKNSKGKFIMNNIKRTKELLEKYGVESVFDIPEKKTEKVEQTITRRIRRGTPSFSF